MIRRALFLGWPGPLWLFPAAGGVMALISFLLNRSLLAAAYPTWSAISSAWHESLWISGSVAAAGASVLGSLLFTRRSAVTSTLRPRLNAGLFLAHSLSLTMWLFLGHCLAMAPAVVWAAREATYGQLDWQGPVVALVGLGTVVTTGLTAGVLLGRWLLAPVVGLLAFVIMTLPNGPTLRPLGLFLPARQFVASIRFELNVATTVFAVLGCLVLCMWAATVARYVLSRGGRHGNRRDVVIWTGACLAMLVTAFAWRPELYVVDRPVAQTCRTTDGGIEICLHQANLTAFDDVEAVTTRLAAEGLAPVLTRVTDYATSDREYGSARSGEAFLSLRPGPAAPGMLAGTVRQQVADEVSAGVTTNHCLFTSSSIASADAVRAVQRRVLELSGFEALAASIFEAEESVVRDMSSDELQQYLRENQEAIASCSLTPTTGRP